MHWTSILPTNSNLWDSKDSKFSILKRLFVLSSSYIRTTPTGSPLETSGMNMTFPLSVLAESISKIRWDWLSIDENWGCLRNSFTVIIYCFSRQHFVKLFSSVNSNLLNLSDRFNSLWKLFSPRNPLIAPSRIDVKALLSELYALNVWVSLLKRRSSRK